MASPETQPLTVALVSSCTRQALDYEASFTHLAQWVRKAANAGAEFVVFPELAFSSFCVSTKTAEAALEIPGEWSKRFAELAKQNDIYISVGLPEKGEEASHVGQLIVGPEGFIGCYRKHHVTRNYPGSEESVGFKDGTKFLFFNIKGWKIGVNICFDGRNQDTIEAMKKAGVDIIHHPHGNCSGDTFGYEAEFWTRSKICYFVPRAVHSRSYILINNSAEVSTLDGKDYHFPGGALILDPLGQVVKRSLQKDNQEHMIVTTLTKKAHELIPLGEQKRDYSNILHTRGLKT